MTLTGAGVKTCKHCAGTFKSYNKTRIYCSHKCYSDDKEEKYCAICKSALGPKRRHHKTCSKACMMQLPAMMPKKELVTAKSGRQYRYSPKPRVPFLANCAQCGANIGLRPPENKPIAATRAFWRVAAPFEQDRHQRWQRASMARRKTPTTTRYSTSSGRSRR